ncbi:MAG: hypothetical protein AVDCRST_MAG55-813, partial [uncultured Rubrobacteraceae bacterium]
EPDAGDRTPLGRAPGPRAVPRLCASCARFPDVGSGLGRPFDAALHRSEGLDDRRAARGRRGGFLGLGLPTRAGGGPALPGVPRPAPILPAQGPV